MTCAIIDIETPPIPLLVSDIKKIYCIAIKINDEETKCYTYLYHPDSDGNLIKALDIINSCDLVVGHNLLKFDKPVIQNVLNKIKPKVVDTLIDAKLVYPKDVLMSIDYSIPDFPKALIGSYSLKAFGYRFGLNKIEYEDFSHLNADMITYCKRDVDLTYELYKHLSFHPLYPKESIRQCEYQVAEVIFKQQEYGFYFDYTKASHLATNIKFRLMNIEHELLKEFPPTFEPDGEIVTPKTTRNNKIYERIEFPNHWRIIPDFIPVRIKKDGTFKFPAKSLKYFPYPVKIRYSRIVGEYQKIKLVKTNISSKQQMSSKLQSKFGWIPRTYTDKANVQLTYDVINDSLKDLGEEVNEDFDYSALDDVSSY
jgi:hypothetical protein